MRELAAVLSAPLLAIVLLAVMLPVGSDAALESSAPPHVPAGVPEDRMPTHRVAGRPIACPATMTLIAVPGPTLWLVPIVASAEGIHHAICGDDVPVAYSKL